MYTGGAPAIGLPCTGAPYPGAAAGVDGPLLESLGLGLGAGEDVSAGAGDWLGVADADWVGVTVGVGVSVGVTTGVGVLVSVVCDTGASRGFESATAVPIPPATRPAATVAAAVAAMILVRVRMFAT